MSGIIPANSKMHLFNHAFVFLNQEINKNAEELITEEEKEKRRAEKRKAKKKVNRWY